MVSVAFCSWRTGAGHRGWGLPKRGRQGHVFDFDGRGFNERCRGSEHCLRRRYGRSRSFRAAQKRSGASACFHPRRPGAGLCGGICGASGVRTSGVWRRRTNAASDAPVSADGVAADAGSAGVCGCNRWRSCWARLSAWAIELMGRPGFSPPSRMSVLAVSVGRPWHFTCRNAPADSPDVKRRNDSTIAEIKSTVRAAATSGRAVNSRVDAAFAAWPFEFQIPPPESERRAPLPRAGW